MAFVQDAIDEHKIASASTKRWLRNDIRRLYEAVGRHEIPQAGINEVVYYGVSFPWVAAMKPGNLREEYYEWLHCKKSDPPILANPHEYRRNEKLLFVQLRENSWILVAALALRP